MKTVTSKNHTVSNFKNDKCTTHKIGFAGTMRLLWKDLFVSRSLFQWLYLHRICECSLVLEV